MEMDIDWPSDRKREEILVQILNREKEPKVKAVISILKKQWALSPKERKILTLRFGIGEEKPHTFKEIGQILNLPGGSLTQQVQYRALRKLIWFGRASGLVSADLVRSDLSPKQVEELIRESDKVLPNILEMPYFLAFSIEKMGFSTSVENSLKDYGIYHFGDLAGMPEEELLKIPNIKKNNLVEIQKMLSRAGLYLGADIGWPSDREQVKQLVVRLNPKMELVPVFAYPIEKLDVPNSNSFRSIVKRFGAGFNAIYLARLSEFRQKQQNSNTISIKTLKDNGIHYFGDLVVKTNLELMNHFNVKQESLTWIKSRLLKVGLQLGMNIDWPSDREEVEHLVARLNPKVDIMPVFVNSIEEMDVSNSFTKIFLIRTLKNNGIHYFGDLVIRNELELLSLKGFGKVMLDVVKASLLKMDLHLGMNLDWPSDREQVEKRVRELTFLH